MGNFSNFTEGNPTNNDYAVGYVTPAGLGAERKWKFSDIVTYLRTSLGTPTETVKGTVEIATQAETDAGTDDIRYITPKKLKALPQLQAATSLASGIIEVATQAEVDAETSSALAVTPLTMVNKANKDGSNITSPSGWRAAVSLASTSSVTHADITVSVAQTNYLTYFNKLQASRASSATNITNSNKTFQAITDTTAPRTVQIASADISTVGFVAIVKDESGGAAANNITITTEGSETINGSATATINTNYGAVRLYSNGTNLFTW